MLNRLDKREAADVLLKQINRNHLMQQRNIETLWAQKPKTFAEYRYGIEHICVFISIGAFYGLALSGRLDLEERIWSFCEGYGVALQLVDDIREVEEDREAGVLFFSAS